MKSASSSKRTKRGGRNNVLQKNGTEKNVEISIRRRRPYGGAYAGNRRRGRRLSPFGWWVLWFEAGMFPKEAKAAVIELCGILPAVGEVFKAEKDFGNQYEIEQKEIFNLPEAFKRCTIDYRVTNIMQQQGKTLIRILQAEEGRSVCAVSEMFLDLIDLKSIDYENGETEPFGPCAISPEAPFVYWGNDYCYLMAGRRTSDGETEAEFWKYLEGTKIV